MRSSLKVNALKQKLSAIKNWVFGVYRKNRFYGILLISIWFGAMIIIIPVLFLYGGWSLVIAYLICKFTGACPL